ncbi:MAG: glycoside hydrolase [Armatimonadetes bacterium]|nr:glycoside hydrolase [Armatimonadota bacterium]
MRITDRGVVARHTSSCPSLAFPGVCVLPDGRWLCGFRAAPTKAGMAGQRALLCWSDDAGRTWTEPMAPFGPPPIGGKPGLFRALYCTATGGDGVVALVYWVDHSAPERPFFNEATEGLLDSRLFISRSGDRGATWSALELLDTAPYDMPTPPTGPVLILSEGAMNRAATRWALQFELNKPYDDPTPWQHSSVLMFSDDEGRTWPEHVRVTGDPANRVFYWDQRPGVLADGTLLDLFWTYDRTTGQYLNIHARRSGDRGRTWGDLWDTGVPGQPSQPVSLPDGRIFMAYVDRSGTPTIKARTSGDGGRTWPAESEILICEPPLTRQSTDQTTMQEAWEEMYGFSLGLPATAALPDGEVLVVYYRGPAADETDIEWVRL